MRYDPAVAPLPEAWLGLDEQARLAAVRQYHKSSHIKLPNAQGHAIVHTIVENQVAGGMPRPRAPLTDWSRLV